MCCCLKTASHWPAFIVTKMANIRKTACNKGFPEYSACSQIDARAVPCTLYSGIKSKRSFHISDWGDKFSLHVLNVLNVCNYVHLFAAHFEFAASNLKWKYTIFGTQKICWMCISHLEVRFNNVDTHRPHASQNSLSFAHIVDAAGSPNCGDSCLVALSLQRRLQ